MGRADDARAAVAERVRKRLAGDECPPPQGDELDEICRGVSDRLCMRLGVSELPAIADSIAVDAAVKVVRRKFYEGVQAESAGMTGSVSTSFFEDALAEYSAEIAGLRSMLAGGGTLSRSKVRFI